MDMPNIPDNRPHKSPVAMEFPDMLDRRSPKPPGDRDGPEAPQQKPPSVLSYTPTTPTIVLDSESEFDAQSRHSGQQSFNSHDLGDEGARSPTPGLRSAPSLRELRRNYMINELPVLQETNPFDGSEQFDPLNEENVNGHSFDLVAPYEGDGAPLHSLERQADLMFSSEHMLSILTRPRYLASFRDFLAQERPRSIATLTYYLNARKALKAIQYANALVRLSVDVPTAGIEMAEQPIGPTLNTALEDRVQSTLDALTAEELPAFITSTCINITSKVVEERVRGTLPDKFQGTADALAEVFCLTDPSRPDNPIIFASGEFHRTTQYGMDYVLGRNCRFLQGPKTNPNSTRRIREAIQAGRHHSELFLNYRRDGSPFMNLLQCAPLCDSQGKVRYFIGAQIDVSGLAMEGAQMDSLQHLQAQKGVQKEHEQSPPSETSAKKQPNDKKSEFQELGELLSPRELQNVHENGGNLFQPIIDHETNRRLWLPDHEDEEKDPDAQMKAMNLGNPTNSLTGVYKHYLLVRPYPSLRILFTSPSLQIPGMLQSSFISRIGDVGPKRDHILHALMAGRSVTARIKWVTRFNVEGRNRWIHCTPLVAHNGQVGVWMVVVIDDDEEHFVRWKGNWPT